MSFLDVLFYIFLIVVITQVAYYLLIFSRFSFSKTLKSKSKNIAVSVIICAKNEAKNLKQFLPLIINQDYHDFEIILINDSSSDNTLDVMESFANQNSNVKIVNVENNEAFWASKKYALTLGIKASKNDYLLFTDADCKPISKYWIKEMSSHFTNQKTIVLGYGGYNKVKNSLLNKLIRFETLLTAIQYFSFAKIGLPYMGVGRNLAYRKDEFFNVNGFIDHMNINSGDDDLFINSIANSDNTAVCYNSNSFTKSIPEKSLKSWYTQKRRHVSTAKKYKLLHKLILAEFYSCQLLFWLVGVSLLVIGYNPLVVIPSFLFVLVVKLLIVGYASKKLNETDLIALTPFLEIFLIFFQLSIFISNLISKPKNWR